MFNEKYTFTHSYIFPYMYLYKSEAIFNGTNPSLME